MRRALITGISGQDGSYLAELLLRKGYEVHGIVRRASSFNTGRLDHIYQDPHEPRPRLQLHYGDLTDSVALVNLIRAIIPQEVYHLGAQSHAGPPGRRRSRAGPQHRRRVGPTPEHRPGALACPDPS